ncbi:Efflux ABC transporter, permease/ATP-binding protein Atu2242 [hydrothermal vent metagenome]|uniref:Efflux ABC transporter, permease/ATP-binding protein Atu2242 n=1 Tax=hydrothermal vent metagenome TaxID=652676 RepID=A0A3B0RD08_9ZZZZ
MFKFFETRIEPFPVAEPVQPPNGLLAFCWYFTSGVWPYLLAVSVLVAFISGLEVLLFGFMGNVVDWLSTADRATFLQDEAATLIWMGFIILIALPVLTLFHSTVLHQTIFGNYPMIIRWQAHRYLLNQSFEFYQDEFAGRIATKVMQASLGVREAVLKILDVMVYVVVYFFGGMILVATFDVMMAIPFVIWLGAYMLVLRYYLPRMADISKRQADARSLMTGRIVDSYTNIMTVKLFAHAGRETTYAKDAMEGFLKTVHPQMRYATMLNLWLNIINSLLLTGVGAIGIWSWIGGASSVGAVAVGAALVLRLNGMSHWIMWELSSMFEHIGMVRDAMDTIAQSAKVRDKPDAKTLVVSKGAISIEQMKFHYGKESGVIDDLSLTITPGEKVGVVGRSGAGKTTLMNVLLRLYDLESGSVRIDGQNIADVTQDSLRSQVGVVTQDTSLLHRSVADNIAYGIGQATREQVIAAAKRASAHEFILDLEDAKGRTGYDAHVGERGVKLSGGQRQRIAIARVFLKDAPILIMDEATSALDSEVEAAIQENLLELMKGKTVIAIAHRLSTISALDRLVVLDQGRIIEEGSHDELIERGGLYADLWNRQSGGFIG